MKQDYPGENKIGVAMIVVAVLIGAVVILAVLYGVAVMPWLELTARTTQGGM